METNPVPTNPNCPAILDAIRAGAKTRAQVLEVLPDLTQTQWARAITQLVSAGAVEREGDRRTATYSAQ